MPTVTAKGAIKATIVLDAAELAPIDVPPGEPRLKLTVRIPGHEGASAAIRVDLNAKSARKAINTIRELGPDNVACFVQGKIMGSTLLEAGLIVTPRKPREEKTEAPKPEPVPAEVAAA
jgi:hypothetical protein